MKENNHARPLLADLTDTQAQTLCAEVRAALIENVSQTGGHLASNLGVVELTVAIHRIFDTSCDRLVFDVGHQCYPHKMLTGRGEKMHTLRQYGGIAGFPKPTESVHDAFIAGHASNSIAVAMGMAKARTALQQQYHVLALIGDGALTGGLAYEGLVNAGSSGEQILVILNDNGMSIAPNVGAMAAYLAGRRLKRQYLTIKKYYRKIMKATWLGKKVYTLTHSLKQALRQSLLPCSMFENMGFQYVGPVDGHDLAKLTDIMRYAKDLQGPVLLHVKTVKGKGFAPAVANPDQFHGVGAFNLDTGAPKKEKTETFSDAFGAALCDLAAQDSRVCALTAAMPDGTGLDKFQELFPTRLIDVGIAEGCAVSVAAGMAKQGMIPVFAVYSTFLQRAYDMLVHDVAIEGLHVVFAVDRAGLVGEDGETHHGAFDVGYLDTIPNMTVLAPANFTELRQMLAQAVFEISGPVALRYPRGGEGLYLDDHSGAPAVILGSGDDLTLVGYGVLINELLQARQMLLDKGISAEIVKLNRITPIDTQLVFQSVRRTGHLIVAEDVQNAGCVGQRITSLLAGAGIAANTRLINLGDSFTAHGAVSQLKKDAHLDYEGIVAQALEVLSRG